MAECDGGVVVGPCVAAVGVEGAVKVVDVVYQCKHVVHLVAATQGRLVQLTEEVRRLFGNGDACGPGREDGGLEALGGGFFFGAMSGCGTVVAYGGDTGPHLPGIGAGSHVVVQQCGEGGGVVLGRRLAVDVEAFFGACQGDVEEVDAVHVGHLPLVVVLAVEKGGLAFYGMDYCSGQRKAGAGVYLHPDIVVDVAFVEDGVEDDGGFEAFGFVDGHEADGVEVGGGIGRDALFLLVEPVEEFGQVVAVAVGVFGHGVEKRGCVGGLDTVEAEHAHQFLAAVVKVEAAEQCGVEGYAVGGQ